MHADWRDLIARDDIDLVSVTGPNFIHRDVAVAAAEAGKHIWIEKPAGRNAAETRDIARRGRWLPDVQLGGRASTIATPRRSNWPGSLITDGRLGQIEHVGIRTARPTTRRIPRVR